MVTTNNIIAIKKCDKLNKNNLPIYNIQEALVFISDNNTQIFTLKLFLT